MKSIERGLLLLLAGVAILDHVSAARAGGDPRALAANEITLLSDQGMTVGSFRISTEGLPELILADAKGHGRIVLAVKSNDDAIIGITDSAGRVRAGLVGEQDGRHSLLLSDESMLPRLTLSVQNKGLPRIALLSAKKKELTSLGVDELESPRLLITTASGDSRLECGTRPTLGYLGLYLLGKSSAQRAGFEIDDFDVSHVFAQDAGAKARADLQASGEGVPSVSLRDKSGKKLGIK